MYTHVLYTVNKRKTSLIEGTVLARKKFFISPACAWSLSQAKSFSQVENFAKISSRSLLSGSGFVAGGK